MGGHLQHAFNWKMVSVRYVYSDPIFIQKQTVIYVCARVDVSVFMERAWENTRELLVVVSSGE